MARQATALWADPKRARETSERRDPTHAARGRPSTAFHPHLSASGGDLLQRSVTAHNETGRQSRNALARTLWPNQRFAFRAKNERTALRVAGQSALWKPHPDS